MTFEESFRRRPELFADYQAFADLFWSRRLVDPTLLELCRIRVAQILGCEGEERRRTPQAVAAGLDEARVAALADWQRSPMLTEVERACLRLTDGFVLDPHGVRDADAAAVAAHLSPREMMALIEALAVFDGFTRFRLILGLEGA
jgi:alkylhydroperoxidase family enzyme